MLPETIRTAFFIHNGHFVCRLIALVCLLCGIFTATHNAAANCFNTGTWAIPDSQGALPTTADRVLDAASKAGFVLLGEAHTNPDHHLWQLQSMAMLLGKRNHLVIGMEMFPRRVQPVLDRWIAGELTEPQLLRQAEWNRVWGYDPDFYLPILRFARLNRIPLVALNVDRSLIAQTGASGWAGIAPEQREGVGDPAPASGEYRKFLHQFFAQHGTPDESAFEQFVQAQLVWDRAFAEALAKAANEHPQSLVVGVIGSGHLRYGYGVPHQLRSLGRHNILVWLPIDTADQCDELADIADAVFGIADREHEPPPRLGVSLEDTANGTEIRDVEPGSVADDAGLVPGDRIVAAAGIQVHDLTDVIAMVRRQPPGTWLPLIISRDGKTMDVVAKFPAALAPYRR
jgi:uncharacterized iron-regulated protein